MVCKRALAAAAYAARRPGGGAAAGPLATLAVQNALPYAQQPCRDFQAHPQKVEAVDQAHRAANQARHSWWAPASGSWQ